jgi:hypothetical protein
MMMSLEVAGARRRVAARLLREGRLVEPGEIVARLDAVTLTRSRRRGGDAGGSRALASVGGRLAKAA